MTKELHAHWMNIIYPLFPEKALITCSDADNCFLAKVSWQLDNDANQPNKRSRVVAIEVPEEVIDEYQNKSKEQQKQDDKKLVLQVEEFLSQFDPNHDSSPEETPPEARIVIGHTVLDS